MRLSYFVTLAIVATTSLAAQDASVGVPSLGFAFDASLRAIRPMRGTPGAALLADPFDLGVPILSSAISPRQDFAIVTVPAHGKERTHEPVVRLVRFQNGGATLQSLDSAMAAPDRVVLSPTGRAALLYRHPGRLQTITGLPDRPVARDWNFAALNGAPAALAVSDDGALIVLAAGAQDSEPVWLLDSDGGASPLPLPGSTVAVAFHGNSRDLLAVAANGDVYLIRGAGSNTPYRMFHGAATSNVVAVQFSPDGARAYTADASGIFSTLDLESGSTARISCGCRAAALDPLTAPNIYRVTPVSDLPLMLFDVSRPEPRIWFVPRARVQQAEGGVL